MREGERHHETVVVIGVFTDQVDPAGRCPGARGGGAVHRGEFVRGVLGTVRAPGGRGGGSVSGHQDSFVRSRCCANCQASRDDFREVGAAGPPAEAVDGGLGGGHQHGRVAAAARGGDLGDGVPGDLADGLDDLAHGEAVAVAEVADQVLARGGGVEGEEVGLGEVGDVDVVADAGAVGGGVVLAEDGDRLALALGDLEDERDEVRLGVVALAAAAVGAGDVEVAQRDGGQAVGRGLTADHVVDGELAGAVRAGGRGLGGLGDRGGLRLAVGGGGGGEDQGADAGVAHRGEQVHGAADVVAPVLLGVHDGLADLGEGGEVQHRVVGGVEPLRGVLDAALDEAGTGGDARAVSGGQVVQHGHLVTGLEQMRRNDAADISRTARDQVLLAHSLATSRSRSAAASGGTSLMNTFMPDSEPARNFSLPEVRRMVKSSR